MKFSIATIAAVLSAGALAAPAAPAPPAGQWTITNMKRVCNDANTSCAYTFGIKTSAAPATPCSFTVTGRNASNKETFNNQCGGFSVGTGHSGSGSGGFVVLPTVWQAKRLQAFPSYSDADLNTEKVIRPNRSFNVQQL